MKSRVTRIVTLISLVLLALLFAYNCSRLADDANMELRRDLQLMCAVTGDFSSSDPMELRAQTLASLSAGNATVKALYNPDGEAYYTSNDRYPVLSEDVISKAQTGKAVVLRHLSVRRWRDFALCRT